MCTQTHTHTHTHTHIRNNKLPVAGKTYGSFSDLLMENRLNSEGWQNTAAM